MATAKIPIGISSCLLGQNVRFDGGHKHDTFVTETLGQFFEFHPLCPEMAIGLGAPRPPMRLVRTDNGIRCVGIKDPTQDFTGRLHNFAEQQQPMLQGLCGYILKKDSPSCGMERVKVYQGEMPRRDGTGIFAQTLLRNNPLLPVEEEGRLGDPGLRASFIERVYVLKRWQDLLSEGLSAQRLTHFHARHKLIIMSRGDYRALGQRLADVGNGDLHAIANGYIAHLMQVLKPPATRSNHVNVLQHIQGYLKKALDSDDKQELCETIEQYRQGLVPLIVPLTLLKHHFRKAPDPYIAESYYMEPYPQALARV